MLDLISKRYQFVFYVFLYWFYSWFVHKLVKLRFIVLFNYAFCSPLVFYPNARTVLFFDIRDFHTPIQELSPLFYEFTQRYCLFLQHFTNIIFGLQGYKYFSTIWFYSFFLRTLKLGSKFILQNNYFFLKLWHQSWMDFYFLSWELTNHYVGFQLFVTAIFNGILGVKCSLGILRNSFGAADRQGYLIVMV